MLTLLKSLDCYTPDFIGKSDILLAGDKIEKIQPAGSTSQYDGMSRVIPCEGMAAFPGLIDQHVHIIGGGGEQGFASRIPELNVNEIFEAGVTTLVGLLGADNVTKNMDSLLAKARSLQQQGVTTYIYSGSYTIPIVTITQNITRDLVLIDKVIGAGEIAISDHRSSQPDINQLLKLASDIHLGGLISGKAGVLHLHVGDGKNGLEPLFQITGQSDLPIEEFVPTHVNRNPRLFGQAIEYCRIGGNIDLTAGETAGLSVAKAVRILVSEGLDLSKVTISSDGNGSICGSGRSSMSALLNDLKVCMVNERLNPQVIIRFATENVAKTLKLFPQKGTLREGSDADLMITDKNFNVRKLFSMGKLVIDKG